MLETALECGAHEGQKKGADSGEKGSLGKEGQGKAESRILDWVTRELSGAVSPYKCWNGVDHETNFPRQMLRLSGFWSSKICWW